MIVYQKTSEWYNEWQRVRATGTMSEVSGITNENEWEQVKSSDFRFQT